jgi:hypothetical protein
MKKNLFEIVLIISLFAMIFTIFACGLTTDISRIRENPQRYEGKKVSVKGQVVETLSIPFVQKGMFQIDDGTGKIWVMSQLRAPFRGDKLTVKGTVKAGLVINEQTYGIIIVEGEG